MCAASGGVCAEGVPAAQKEFRGRPDGAGLIGTTWSASLRRRPRSLRRGTLVQTYDEFDWEQACKGTVRGMKKGPSMLRSSVSFFLSTGSTGSKMFLATKGTGEEIPTRFGTLATTYLYTKLQ